VGSIESVWVRLRAAIAQVADMAKAPFAFGGEPTSRGSILGVGYLIGGGVLSVIHESLTVAGAPGQRADHHR
jgi:hypothetical protein